MKPLKEGKLGSSTNRAPLFFIFVTYYEIVIRTVDIYLSGKNEILQNFF
mgnify:CR=1 FL=1